MRKLTMLTLATMTAHATAVVLAPPALADDGQGAALPAATAAPALADVLRTSGRVAAVLLGIVLLSRALGRYRASQWRRQWVLRRTTETLFVSSVRWPAGGISGRSIARPTAGIVGGTVTRSSTRL